jgi:hypothetical protein
MDKDHTERMFARVVTMRLCAAIMVLSAIVLAFWADWFGTTFGRTASIRVHDWRTYVPIVIGGVTTWTVRAWGEASDGQ